MQHHDIAALHITEISQALFECLRIRFALLGCTRNHSADSPDLAGLLSSGMARQRQSNTAHCANNIATPHSMTSSARPSTVGGIVRPSALAVLRLISSSNFVGCSTGRSPGWAPLRILSTYPAARRTKSAILVP